MNVTLRQKPHSDGGQLYWWNNAQGWNAFALSLPPHTFRTEQEARDFLALQPECTETAS